VSPDMRRSARKELKGAYRLEDGRISLPRQNGHRPGLESDGAQIKSCNVNVVKCPRKIRTGESPNTKSGTCFNSVDNAVGRLHMLSQLPLVFKHVRCCGDSSRRPTSEPPDT